MSEQIIFLPGSYVRLGDSGDWVGKTPVRKPSSKGVVWSEVYIETATKPWTLFGKGVNDGDFVLMRCQMTNTNPKHRSMELRMWGASEGESMPKQARKFASRLTASGNLELHLEGDSWVAVYERVDDSTEP